MFIRSGYECLRSLILQSFSQFNKLTDETLKNEIGIDKIGHRLRILSQLRQDALVLFQMEIMYRQAKDVQKTQVLVQDDSLFVLPGRQQQHFKSVYSEANNQNKHNDSLVQQRNQAQLQNPQAHHHMSQQQPQSKKLRPRNYSFSKGVSESVPSSQQTSYRQYQQQVPSGLSRQKTAQVMPHAGTNFSYIKDHVESNLNPWRHSTYFDQSRPINSQNSHYTANQSSVAADQNHPFQAKQNPHLLDESKVQSSQQAALLEYQKQLREAHSHQQAEHPHSYDQQSATGPQNRYQKPRGQPLNGVNQHYQDEKSCTIF